MLQQKNCSIPQSMYCVGYSVLYYSLDNQWMKYLEGQKGNQAKVKVLAAFLLVML